MKYNQDTVEETLAAGDIQPKSNQMVQMNSLRQRMMGRANSAWKLRTG